MLKENKAQAALISELQRDVAAEKAGYPLITKKDWMIFEPQKQFELSRLMQMWTILLNKKSMSIGAWWKKQTEKNSNSSLRRKSGNAPGSPR